MSEPKLRPCPFCGGTSASFVCHDPDAGFPHLDVVCNDCGARVETPADWGDRELAAGIWNTRPDDAERERLRSLIGRLLPFAEKRIEMEVECGNAVKGVLGLGGLDPRAVDRINAESTTLIAEARALVAGEEVQT